MTWKECRDSALCKMFGMQDGVLDEEESGNRDYLKAMPYAANEAMLRICDAGAALRKTLRVQVMQGEASSMMDLLTLAPDFKSAGSHLQAVWLDESGNPAEETRAQLWMGRFLLLPAGRSGNLLVGYDAWPPEIDETTADDFEMPLSPAANALIPLYLAGELYKDDDASLATLFMNEFEAKLVNLQPQNDATLAAGFFSETGWC